MLLQTPAPPFDVVPIMGMATGIVSMILFAIVVVRVAQSQIGQAIARRISGKHSGGDELQQELLDLRETVAHLEARVAEGEERLDFAERLLSRGKDEASSRA